MWNGWFWPRQGLHCTSAPCVTSRSNAIVLDLPVNEAGAAFGVLLSGPGHARADVLGLELAGPDVPTTGLANVQSPRRCLLLSASGKRFDGLRGVGTCAAAAGPEGSLGGPP